MGKLDFTKMHGCGNDYVYIDCFKQDVEAPELLARTLSDRHKGVGGDGVILICPSETADAKMRMFNADGSEGQDVRKRRTLCGGISVPPRICLGHGGRCRNAFGREAHRPQRAGPADRRHGRAGTCAGKKFP